MIELTDFSKNNFEKVKSIIKDMGKSKLIFQSEAQFQHVLAMRLEKEIADNKDFKIYLEAYTNDYPNDGEKKKVDNKNEKGNQNAKGEEKVKRCYTDIVILDNKNMQYIAIELKYKTDKLEYNKGNFFISLTEHSACDTGCYDYLWDIERINKLTKNTTRGNLKSFKCIGGCAIFLTNENYYWKHSRLPKPKNNENDKRTNHNAFLIGDGSDIKKTDKLNWYEDNKDNKSNNDNDLRHKTSITLEGVKESKFEWQEYCILNPADCNLENSKAKKQRNIFKYLFLTV